MGQDCNQRIFRTTFSASIRHLRTTFSASETAISGTRLQSATSGPHYLRLALLVHRRKYALCSVFLTAPQGKPTLQPRIVLREPSTPPSSLRYTLLAHHISEELRHQPVGRRHLLPHHEMASVVDLVVAHRRQVSSWTKIFMYITVSVLIVPYINRVSAG